MKEYKVIAMNEEELISILKQNGIDGVHLEYDMGCVSIINDDGDYFCTSETEQTLCKHFNVDKLYMFCSDTDQRFPDDIMVMLDFNPYES